MKNRTIWSRGKKVKGVIKSISSRYCGACGMNSKCYIVEWEDGKKTKPCLAGIRPLNDGSGDLIII